MQGSISSACSFYAPKSQNCHEGSQLKQLFALLGSVGENWVWFTMSCSASMRKIQCYNCNSKNKQFWLQINLNYCKSNDIHNMIINTIIVLHFSFDRKWVVGNPFSLTIGWELQVPHICDVTRLRGYAVTRMVLYK